MLLLLLVIGSALLAGDASGNWGLAIAVIAAAVALKLIARRVHW